jgi:hypothetical protein
MQLFRSTVIVGAVALSIVVTPAIPSLGHAV